MKSPFPGMDPYLERYWPGVHNKFIAYMSDGLNERLPPDLRAELTERVLVSSPEHRRGIVPDVYVTERKRSSENAGAAQPGDLSADSAGVAVAEPLVIRFPDEKQVETTIHITDLDGSTLITAVELLSPSNKLPGPDREIYLRKRHEYYSGGVNLVEIDLFRPGERTLENVDAALPPERRSPYLVIVKRGNQNWDEWEVTPLPLRHRLPAVRIPLRPTDPDLPFDLQPLIDRAYTNGRYPIDYRRNPNPPFEDDDVEWADRLLREAGLR